MRMSPLLKLLPDSCHWTPRVRVYQCFAPVWRSIWRELAGAAVAVLALVQPAAFAKAQPEGTHRQAAILKPDPQRKLLTFVVAPDGSITAALEGVPSSPGFQPASGLLRVYSPERELIREIALPVYPEALSLFGDAGYLVAGSGKLLHVSQEGKVLREARILDLLGVNERMLRVEALRAANEDVRRDRSNGAQEIASLEEALKKLESGTPQTDRQKARIESTKRMLQQRRRQLRDVPTAEELLESYVLGRTQSPSVSSDGQSILLTLNRYRQYEVIRLNSDFRNPRRILGNLEGCCGQMDVYLSRNTVFTAENTRFKVAVYDLQGKKQREFGEKHRDDNQGFGSCCNPMNVWVYPNGDVLTAESSIGTLKRFSPEGKLLGVIGRARIGGGCKHVAIGFDPGRDRYYVQYQDRNHICVLLPNEEAYPFIAAQVHEIAEGEDLMGRLSGEWSVEPRAQAKTPDQYDAVFEGHVIQHEDWIAETLDRTQTFTIQPTHGVILDKKASSKNPARKSFLRWVVTGFQGDTIQIELEEADGCVRLAGTLRQPSETALEFRVENLVWKLTKH